MGKEKEKEDMLSVWIVPTLLLATWRLYKRNKGDFLKPTKRRIYQNKLYQRENSMSSKEVTRELLNKM